MRIASLIAVPGMPLGDGPSIRGSSMSLAAISVNQRVMITSGLDCRRILRLSGVSYT